jgi:hypothetical protein
MTSARTRIQRTAPHRVPAAGAHSGAWTGATPLAEVAR